MTPRPPEAPRRRKLLVHQDVLEWMDDPRSDRQLQQRARLVFSQLAAQGMPPQVKGVQGPGRGWLRTDLGGNNGHQFYLWWTRAGAPPVKHLGLAADEILVRVVRHHDTGRHPRKRPPWPLFLVVKEPSPQSLRMVPPRKQHSRHAWRKPVVPQRKPRSWMKAFTAATPARCQGSRWRKPRFEAP